eukprot:TRINITY_DN10687_c0_g1_i3.p1 TRINITY_DN10687_c0_g1~~TRINITY_DN10687_c0_g1_i3.p1  ORF type:complete len:327 (+),score=64.35 TRINITY_DN10687_c0_g1_i3:91-1071(+)
MFRCCRRSLCTTVMRNTMPNETSRTRVGIFVDAENVDKSCREELKAVVNKYGRVVTSLCYGGLHTLDWSEDGQLGGMQHVLVEPMDEMADMRLAYDVVTKVQAGNLDLVMLVTGDSDFAELANYVRSQGVVVHAFGFWSETNNAFKFAVDTFHTRTDSFNRKVNISVVTGREAPELWLKNETTGEMESAPPPSKGFPSPLHERFAMSMYDVTPLPSYTTPDGVPLDEAAQARVQPQFISRKATSTLPVFRPPAPTPKNVAVPDQNTRRMEEAKRLHNKLLSEVQSELEEPREREKEREPPRREAPPPPARSSSETFAKLSGMQNPF